MTKEYTGLSLQLLILAEGRCLCIVCRQNYLIRGVMLGN